MVEYETGGPQIHNLPWAPKYLLAGLVVTSQDKITPLEKFHPRTELLPLSRSIPGLNDSPGVVLSQDRTTPMESFYPRTQ